MEPTINKFLSQFSGVMSLNDSGFRTIERVTGVHHTTVITWVKQVSERLPDSYASEEIPEVGELDELQTFVGSKKTKSGSGRRLIISNLAF